MKFRMIHENFNVADLDRSLAFYDKALGLKEKRRKVGKDGAFIIVYLDNEYSDFVMMRILSHEWKKQTDQEL